MFHPFKRLETAWNARTPKFLHNHTKENFIFQLIGLVVILLVMYVKDKYDERQMYKHLDPNPNDSY